MYNSSTTLTSTPFMFVHSLTKCVLLSEISKQLFLQPDNTPGKQTQLIQFKALKTGCIFKLILTNCFKITVFT